ncbi:hypothetical protein ACFLXQ_09065 [Chloroflexota bacterium]
MSEEKNLVPVEEYSLEDLQRERDILKVFHFLLYETKENGRSLTVKQACKAAGIPFERWNEWSREGYTISPLKEIGREISQMAYDNIIPAYEAIIGGLVQLAQGRKPAGSDITDVRAGDMLAAIKQLQTMVPIQSLDAISSNHKSEFQHLEEFQPQVLDVKVLLQTGDHIYQPGSGGEGIGKIESIKDEVEGEIIEVEVSQK